MTIEEKFTKLIADFKRYDNNRKKYYADKMLRLGKLESFIQEVESETGINDVVNVIKNLKDCNNNLKKVNTELRIELDRVRLLFNPEILHIYRNLSNKDRLLMNKILELKSCITDYKDKLAKSKKLANEYLVQLIKKQSK